MDIRPRTVATRGIRGVSKSLSKHSTTPYKILDVSSPQNPFQSRGSSRNDVMLPLHKHPELASNMAPLRTFSQQRIIAPNLRFDSSDIPQTAKSNSNSNNSANTNMNSSNISINNSISGNLSNFTGNQNSSRMLNNDPELVSMSKNQVIFEKFMLDTLSRPLCDVVEELLMTQFHAREVVFWQDIPSLHTLYSKKLNMIVSHSDGLVGFVFFQRKQLILEVPNDHPAFKTEIDRCTSLTDTNPLSLLSFTLFDNNGNVAAVVQIKRLRTDPFVDERELDFLKYFIAKFPVFFTIYDRIELPQESILGLLQKMDIDQFLLNFQKQMSTLFHCRAAEIWKLDMSEGELFVYKKTKIAIQGNSGGIASESIDRRYPINCISNRMMSSYNEVIDGKEIEPVLCVPLSDIKRNVVHCVVVRGGRIPVFNMSDQACLQKLVPYIVLALNNIEDLQKAQQERLQDGEDGANNTEKRCVEAVLTMIDQIHNQTDLTEIISNAIENLELMTHSDRSTLFTLERKGDLMMKTIFSTSRNFPSIVEPNRTYVARSAELGQVFNIADCYEEIDFDSSLDLTTKYHTRSLLTVPLMNGRSEYFGAVEFTNRTDGLPFPNKEVPFVKIILLFLGLLIDGEKLEKEVSSSTEQLKTFLSSSLALVSDTMLQEMFKNMLVNINNSVEAASSAIFIHNKKDNNNEYTVPQILSKSSTNFNNNDDDDNDNDNDVVNEKGKNNKNNANKNNSNKNNNNNNSNNNSDNKDNVNNDDTLTSFVSAGDPLQRYVPLSHGFPALCYKSKEVIIANDALHDQRYVRDPCDLSGVVIKSVCIAPIMISQKVCGVIEIANKQNSFTADDINVLRSISTLISLSLERRELNKVSEIGNVDFEIDKWIDEVEKPEYVIANRLKIVTTMRMDFENMSFDSFSKDHNLLMRYCIDVFEQFGLLNEFKIDCETIFTLIYKIRESYVIDKKEVKYHNWFHAVDVMHFSYVIGRFLFIQKKISRIDLLVLLVSSLLQDAGHKGYNSFAPSYSSQSSNVSLTNEQSDENIFNFTSFSSSSSVSNSKNISKHNSFNDSLIAAKLLNKQDVLFNASEFLGINNDSTTTTNNNNRLNYNKLNVSNENIKNENISNVSNNSSNKENNKNNKNENNVFLKQTEENIHHCATAIKILTSKESNIFKNMTKDDQKKCWNMILRLIYVTDMTKHFMIVQKANKLSEIKWKNENDKIIGLSLILKCATMSFICNKESICEKTVDLIRGELETDFFLKTNSSTKNGENAFIEDENEFKNKVKEDEKNKYIGRMREELGFAEIIAAPLFRSAAKLINELKEPRDICEENIMKWKLTLYPPMTEEPSSIVIGANK